MEHRDEFITVRLSKSERAQLEEMCVKAGLPISAVIRNLLLGVEIKERQPQDITDLYVEINRVGNNINQIARSVNSGIATPETAKEALFLLEKVYELMERIAKS